MRGCWSPKTNRLGVLEKSDGCVFLLSEYDFCLFKWIRADFTPQIERDKQIMNIQGVPGGMDKPSGDCSLC